MYRPWGDLSWLTGQLSINSWKLLGCLSPEERSTSVLFHLSEEEISGSTFLEVDSASGIYAQEAQSKRERNKLEIVEKFGINLSASLMNLLVKPNQLDEIYQTNITGNENIILDISSFPKRYFFYILKKLYLDNEVKNLIVTYSKPESYSEGLLSTDINYGDPLYLPGFLPESEAEEYDVLITGVGFPKPGDGMDKILSDNQQIKEVKLIFPFPPGPPLYFRNWEFLSRLRNNSSDKISPNGIIRVPALDAPTCFDSIKDVSENGSKLVILSPLGPKPHSMAMCLYATLYKSSVQYAQPTQYNPNYSKGRRISENNIPVTRGYLIKYEGRKFYS